MRVSRRQVHRNMVPVVSLEFGSEHVISLKKYLCQINETLELLGGGWRLTYPANSFQSSGINLVYVVDLRGGVVVLAIANDVDQVVVGEVRDDVAEVRECPSDKSIKVPTV